jgi:hypothetical protein
MRNKKTNGDYDYSPNELAKLSMDNNKLYREIVNSNLEQGDTIEKYHARNLAWAKECLAEQRRNRC